MGRLSNLRIVDPVLTNIALGYTNNEFVGEQLMPFVPVEKESSKLPKFGKEAFKLVNTERALRAESNRINPEGVDSMDLVTDEHDVEYPIDYRESAEAAFPIEAWGVEVTQQVIQLRREKTIADMAQNPANYPAGNKIALVGPAQFTSKTTSDPLGVIEDGKDAVRGKTGKIPNTIVIGASAMKSLKFHPQLLELIKYTSKGIVRLDSLRELFDIPNVFIGGAIFSSDQDVFTDVWRDNIVLAYVGQKPTTEGVERSPYQPSFGYTPRRRGMPQIDTRNPSGKVELVRSTDHFRPYIVGADAGYLISDTNA